MNLASKIRPAVVSIFMALIVAKARALRSKSPPRLQPPRLGSELRRPDTNLTYRVARGGSGEVTCSCPDSEPRRARGPAARTIGVPSMPPRLATPSPSISAN